MKTDKLVLSTIPEDERSPLVDGLLKFINWQTERIEKLEIEIRKLQKRKEKRKLKDQPGGTDKAVIDRKHSEKTKKIKNRKKPAPPKGNEQPIMESDKIRHTLLDLANKNKRQFTRINIQWDVQLDFGSSRCRQTINNISLSGIYVKGKFDQQEGDICTIVLNQSGADEDVEIHAIGSIIRIDSDGMALEFTSMKLDNFFLLQTILLYEAADPAILGSEFVNNINLELENDIILCDASKC